MKKKISFVDVIHWEITMYIVYTDAIVHIL